MFGLDKVFEDFESVNLIAWQNSLCCMSCSLAELDNYYNDLPEEDKVKITGIVYYHEQDSEHCVNDTEHRLYLGYSSVADNDNDTEVGELVRDILLRNHIEIDWNGSPEVKIRIKVPVVTDSDRKQVRLFTENALDDDEEDD